MSQSNKYANTHSIATMTSTHFTIQIARLRLIVREEKLNAKLSSDCTKSSDWRNTVRAHSGTSKLRSSSAPNCRELADHFARKLTLDDADGEPPDFEPVDAKTFKSFRNKESRVKKVLDSLHPGKSVNVISPRMLNEYSKSLLAPIAMLSSHIARKAEWPKKWKEGRVSPIWKRGSNSVPKNYRPVTVLDNISLAFERVVDPQFDSFCTYSFWRISLVFVRSATRKIMERRSFLS